MRIQQHTTSIRFGLILAIFAPVFLAPYFAVISTHMKRIEGQDSPLAYAQMMLGVCTVLAFMLPPMMLQGAAFRPDRNPDILLALVDVTCVWFWGLTGTIVIELVIIGIVVLRDDRPDPWFPRWFGYFNIWASFGFAPATFLVFFKTGPLAWNGFFTVWPPVLTFAVWVPVVIWNITQASKKTEAPQVILIAGTDGNRSAQNGSPDHDAVQQQIQLLATELGKVRGQLAEMEGRRSDVQKPR